MKELVNKYNLIPNLIDFIGLPMFIWDFGDVLGRKNDCFLGQTASYASCCNKWTGVFKQYPSTKSAEMNYDLDAELNYMVYVNDNPLKLSLSRKEVERNVDGGSYNPAEFKIKGQSREERRPPKVEGAKGNNAPPGIGGIPVGGSSAGMNIHKYEGLVIINA